MAESLSGKVQRTGNWQSASASVVVSEQPITVTSADDVAGSLYGERFRQGAILVPRLFVLVENADPVPFATREQRSVHSRRTSLDKAPWKSLPDIVGAIESHFIRPVLLGESVVPFAVVGPFEGVIPWTKATGFLGSDDPRMDEFPGFAKWWREAGQMYMANRSSDKRTLLEQLNYMRQLEAQFPIASIRVVYTKTGATLAAAIVSDQRSVIDHSLYWSAVATTDEGRYLCGILNAPCFTDAIRPYQSEGAFGPRHFDKYVWRLPTPIFEPENPLHARIVESAMKAEAVAVHVSPPDRGGFKIHRRAIRDALAEAGIASELDEAVRELLGIAG